MAQLNKTEKQGKRRIKRGLFNFVGQISHSFSGTLGSDNEEFDEGKISQEEEQADLVKLSKEQIVVKNLH
jgi:hypothetical protein